jgi:drug/metabolite transporter (DMT)-like permease
MFRGAGMVELWIPITIVAAFMQNARSALQKHLKGRLSTLGATYVRFLYALPFAILYVAALGTVGGEALPAPNRPFLLYALLGGVTQIVFTALLMWLFSFRNFAVGTTFSKTEVVQVAILGLLILGDTLTPLAAVAIAVAAAGVMILSAGQTNVSAASLLAGLSEKPTMIGLASGAFLGASVVFFRGAALSLEHDSVVMAAAFTLAVALVIQTAVMGLYLAWKEPATLRDVLVHWRWRWPSGLPACWLRSAGSRPSPCRTGPMCAPWARSS